MNVLIILKSFNYPPKNGGDQAVISAIRALAPHVSYHLLSLDESGYGNEVVSRFRKDFPEIPAAAYSGSKGARYRNVYMKCLRICNYLNNRIGFRNTVNMRLLQDYDARLDYRDDLYRYINSYIAEHSIDIVQAEFSFTLGFLKGITGNVKRLFVQHEIQFVVNHQRLMQRSHTDEDIYFYEQERRQEIDAMNCCDAIITLSDDDKSKLIANGVHAPVFASFAQVEVRDVKIPEHVELQKRLVFIGPETHLPNRQGLQWFLDDVWQKILSKEPDTRLAIIGKWSQRTAVEWSKRYKNVEFLGFVDDLATAIKDSILIVPLFQGSGIRMKILEACNTGIPFVATTIGAEGLGFVDGVNAYIEDDATLFAEKTLRLLADRQLANDFIRKAVEYIRANFSDQNFVETRMKAYKSLI